MKKITFDQQDFLSDKYVDYSLEDTIVDEYKIHNIINGIFAISSVYASYISGTLPILYKIDQYKSSRKNVADDLRKALLLHTVNKVTDINDFEKDDKLGIYNIITNTYEFKNNTSMLESAAFPYKLSLKSIKNGLDDLFIHIKYMVSDHDILNWKKYYFLDIENDIHRIYNEIVCYEFMFAAAIMNSKAIEKIEFIRSQGSRGNKIKIKSISDIAKYSYEAIKTLKEFYSIVIETNYTMLSNVDVDDPNHIISNSDGKIENVHKDIELILDDLVYNSSDDNNGDNSIEDFINTDE